MDKPIEQYTDSELMSVIRDAENSNIPGSRYQKAKNEWDIRQQIKLTEATKKWYEKPLGIILLTVISAGIIYWLGWNN